MADHHQVVVLGAGSAGEALASQLAADGMSVAVVESSLVGGECPFVACMPSKAVLHVASRHQATEHVAGALSLDHDQAYARAVGHRDEVTSGRDDSAHARSLRDAGVTLVRGCGQVTAGSVLEVDGDDRATLSWDDLVIATGSATTVLPVEGLDHERVWTSEDAWTTDTLPASIVVVGGGAVGCEVAQGFARFGVDVTIVEMADRLVSTFDEPVSEWLAGHLADEGIDVRLGTQVERAEHHPDGSVTAHLADDAIRAERLVLAAGVTPRLTGMGLEHLGIDPSAGLEIDDRCRVKGAERVWAIGDVTSVAPFTHTANYQARVAATNLSGGDARADLSAVPRAVYVEPTVAGVGLTADGAREAGHDVVTTQFDVGQTARASAEASAGGRLVLTADRDRGVLLGASAVGPHAAEWLGEVTLAIRAGTPLDVLADVIHAFPTYAEALGACYRDLASQVG